MLSGLQLLKTVEKCEEFLKISHWRLSDTFNGNFGNFVEIHYSNLIFVKFENVFCCWFLVFSLITLNMYVYFLRDFSGSVPASCSLEKLFWKNFTNFTNIANIRKHRQTFLWTLQNSPRCFCGKTYDNGRSIMLRYSRGSFKTWTLRKFDKY